MKPSTTRKVTVWALVILLCATGAIFGGAIFRSSATFASEPDASESAASETATLRISLKRGAVRGRSGRFEFFDASDGCPEEYVDIPGAKVFFGQTVAVDKGATKMLPVGQAIHVLHLGGRGAMKGMVSGGISEQRRRALQVVLTGDAELRVVGFEDFVPLWEASGQITVVPATACESDGDKQPVGSQSAPDSETDSEADLEADPDAEEEMSLE